MNTASGYLKGARHPWPCLLFMLPLLIAYEAGVLSMGGPHPESVRNGADYWVRYGLGYLGLKFFWIPPTVLALVFLFRAWRNRRERPADLGGTLSGMTLESVTFALGLWALSRVLGPMLTRFGVELAVSPSDGAVLDTAEPGLRQVITYLGAGIYEEAIFRLVLFSMLSGILRWFEAPRVLCVGVAAVASAVVFSAAHHVGPYGQEYSNYLFVFRLLAGTYFSLLYEFRGFGIAVGTHACYNVMVSIPPHV
jgi:membrane protease YdiL (CAAX protease family)